MGCDSLEGVFAQALSDFCECYNIEIITHELPKKWWQFWK